MKLPHTHIPYRSLHRWGFVLILILGSGLVALGQSDFKPKSDIVYRMEAVPMDFDFTPLPFLLVDSNTVDSLGAPKEDSIPPRFTDVSDKLLLSTGLLFKSYTISVENVSLGKTLFLSPTGSANIAFGLNYKWFGIMFSFGFPTNSKDEEEFGNSEKQDFQLNFYTNTFVVQGHLQYYKGFHVSEFQEEKDGPKTKKVDKTPIIPSLETYSVGLSSWYFVNHKKFSYKAAYIRNAIQTKSAGSIVAGLFYSLDIANAKTNIANGLPDSIKVDFDVIGYRSRSIGIAAGYTYTLVIKEKFFINGTAVPGIGLKNVSLSTENRKYEITDGFTGRLTLNFSMGYEAKHFIVGLRAFTSSRFFEANGYRITPSTNSMTIYVGKRFNVKRKK